MINGTSTVGAADVVVVVNDGTASERVHVTSIWPAPAGPQLQPLPPCVPTADEFVVTPAGNGPTVNVTGPLLDAPPTFVGYTINVPDKVGCTTTAFTPFANGPSPLYAVASVIDPTDEPANGPPSNSTK